MSLEPYDDEIIDAEIVDDAGPAEPEFEINVGVYAELDEDLYHRGVCAGGEESLSHSGMKTLLGKTPAHYRHEVDHRDERESNAAFDLGHAFHQRVLGVGAPIIEVRATDWRTNAAKAQRDEYRAAGYTPLLSKDYRRVMNMVDSFFEHLPYAAENLRHGAGHPEVSIFARDPDTKVMLRARLDWLTLDRRTIIDVKTAADADPYKFGKRAFDFGYYLQRAVYPFVAQLAGLPIEDMVFVQIESAPPYLPSITRLTADDVEFGMTQARRAIAMFAECQTTGRWPGYPVEPVTVSLPPWATRARTTAGQDLSLADPHSDASGLLDDLERIMANDQ